ncbi:MAG: thioredoxin domain-containing protein [Gammaproteobacteria bacterium]|nr:thioredoxin domain-containing protein [Gammaproteobacteria bacterium]
MNKPDNKLSQETSPYLLQHADNPVNWRAWNQDALDEAQHKNKPILLSVGYSACHWCHVMAHESFEDKETARIMNEHFINIKVDREERPDLDKIYQHAHSMLTGRPGGWPLTVFLTPADQMPFFAGTYFPKQRKYNMPSFQEIMATVSNVFSSRKDDIEKQNTSLKSMLNQITQHDKNTAASLNALPLDLARKQMLTEFDHIHGGFSGAPKFPHPAMLERAMRHWALSRQQQHNDEDILDSAIFTLQKMAMGGIFDHIGGGFCRYSTDELWMIPHFEKMLSDNGQLLPLYAYAYQITRLPLFKHAAIQTADWAQREMQSTEGGYYSAIDADSEGEEGKFYVWSPTEVKNLLAAEDYEIFAHCYGLDKTENFVGHWHLHAYISTEKLAEKFNISEQDIFNTLNRCRKILFDQRSKRITPGIDDKILCSWNALMIRGMCIAGKLLDKPEYIHSAQRALEFIKNTLWDDQHLLATYKDNKAHLNAYLDDYAYLLNALIEYLQCTWDNDMLDWANNIAATLLNNFEDKNKGGFYFTSHEHEKLIQRSKTFADEAIPSGNGIAAFALQRLGLLLGNTDYLNAAENCIKAGSNDFQQHAIMNCSLLNGLEELLHAPVIIIIRGNASDLTQWKTVCDAFYHPAIISFAIASDIKPATPIDNKKPLTSTSAYICEGSSCLPPITDLDDLKSYIHQHSAHQKSRP